MAADPRQQPSQSDHVADRDISHISQHEPSSQASGSRPSQSSASDGKMRAPTTPPTSESERDGLSQTSLLERAASPQEALYAGQKRTADGMLPQRRRSSTAPSHSRNTSTASRHSRNTSTASSTARSTLGEMGDALRTKLSYAMVKVNHGWQDMPIADVESLTSPGRRVVASPRVAMANYRRTEDLALAMQQGEPTYESFWRSHAVPRPRTLAPPADIQPRSNSRRSGPRDVKPMLAADAVTSPRTPRTPHRAMLQTPAQKSLQEQDAIETLLFMSSPGNSQLGPRPTQPQSPLKEDTATTSTDSPRLDFPRPPDTLDQQLDSMESSDSEDLELVVTPRRVVGRA